MINFEIILWYFWHFFNVGYNVGKMPEEKEHQKFSCVKCNFVCCKKYNYDKHLLTLKHKILQNPTLKNAKNANYCEKIFECPYCEKKYKHSSSYYSHKKQCALLNNIESSEGKMLDVMAEQNQILMEQNKQLLEQHNDLKKMIVDICKNGTTNQYNSINSHNKTFNLQFFLNETCKDAMNLTDFVNSIQLQLTDLENVGKNGFVSGISNIIINNLQQLDITQRPVHCSDQKREIMYVKEENQWFNDSKEMPENQKLKKVIKQIAHKNICLISDWKSKYPDCIYSDSRKSDQYNHIIYESMSQNDENAEKIIKKIAKEVIIDK